MFFIIVLLFNFGFIFAQSEVLGSVPGGQLIEKIVDEDGNPTDGVEDIKDKIVQVKNGTDINYLRQELTKMPYVGAFFRATEGFFSFFNPLWKYSFGIEFSWQLLFLLHMILWFVIIFAIYYPAKEMLNNSLFAIAVGVVVASITGNIGIISKFVGLLETMFGKLWWLTSIVIVILILLIILEKTYFEKSRKSSKKEKLKRADDARLAAGNASKRMIEGMSESGRKQKGP